MPVLHALRLESGPLPMNDPAILYLGITRALQTSYFTGFDRKSTGIPFYQ